MAEANSVSYKDATARFVTSLRRPPYVVLDHPNWYRTVRDDALECSTRLQRLHKVMGRVLSSNSILDRAWHFVLHGGTLHDTDTPV